MAPASATTAASAAAALEAGSMRCEPCIEVLNTPELLSVVIKFALREGLGSCQNMRLVCRRWQQEMQHVAKRPHGWRALEKNCKFLAGQVEKPLDYPAVYTIKENDLPGRWMQALWENGRSGFIDRQLNPLPSCAAMAMHFRAHRVTGIVLVLTHLAPQKEWLSAFSQLGVPVLSNAGWPKERRAAWSCLHERSKTLLEVVVSTYSMAVADLDTIRSFRLPLVFYDKGLSMPAQFAARLNSLVLDIPQFTSGFLIDNAEAFDHHAGLLRLISFNFSSDKDKKAPQDNLGNESSGSSDSEEGGPGQEHETPAAPPSRPHLFNDGAFDKQALLLLLQGGRISHLQQLMRWAVYCDG